MSTLSTRRMRPVTTVARGRPASPDNCWCWLAVWLLKSLLPPHPPDDLAEIERLAARLDFPPASLIRRWILSGLNAHKDETVQTTIDRISADVQPAPRIPSLTKLDRRTLRAPDHA